MFPIGYDTFPLLTRPKPYDILILPNVSNKETAFNISKNVMLTKKPEDINLLPTHYTYKTKSPKYTVTGMEITMKLRAMKYKFPWERKHR